MALSRPYGLKNLLSTKGPSITYRFSSRSPLQLRKASNAATTAIPDTLPKNADKFVYLTSVDKLVNKNFANWDRVSIAFQTYYQRRDAKSSFRLANRIIEMNLSPPPKVLGLILRHLSEQDLRLASSAILTIFETVVEQNSRLSSLALTSLIWSMRRSNDAFVRTAFFQLFQKYFEYEPPKRDLTISVKAAYLHSLVESGELEESKRVFEEFIASDVSAEQLREFPWKVLFESFVSKWSEAELGIAIIQSMENLNVHVPPHFWHALLESCISNRHDEGLDFLWKRGVQTGKITPSTASLRSVFELFIESKGNDITADALQKLSLQDGSSAVLDSEIPMLLDVLLTSPTTMSPKNINLEFLFRSIQALHAYAPSIDVRDLDVPCKTLWNLIHDQNIRSEQVIAAIIDTSRTNGNPNPKLLTFLTNFVLRSFNQHQAASTCIHFYRSLIQQGAIPDACTFESLAFAALCLGNSKKLGYLIYEECKSYKVEPSRRMIELLVRGSLKGTDYTSALYYVSKLDAPRKQLSSTLLQHLIRSFSNAKDNRLEELLSNRLATRGNYVDFPPDSILEKSATAGSQTALRYSFRYDKGNCYRFVHGWPSDQLSTKAFSHRPIM